MSRVSTIRRGTGDGLTRRQAFPVGLDRPASFRSNAAGLGFGVDESEPNFAVPVEAE